MLTEFQNVRQIPGEGLRRWFADDYFDLIVWYQDDAIDGFQLCYDRDGCPRAYTWTRSRGASHEGIDDGDDPLLTYKATPILVADGPFDVEEISKRFREACRVLPSDIQDVVITRLDAQRKGWRYTADL